MIALGSTSDILVAGLLAISQLITPVPPQAAEKATARIEARHSCWRPNSRACKIDEDALASIHFHPLPLERYLSMPNAELVDNLHQICVAVQDRVFLSEKQWKNGQTANRDDFASKLVVMAKPEIQQSAAKIVQEVADGQFKVPLAYKVLMALCHWKVDRRALGRQFDFTGGQRYLNQLLSELPKNQNLPALPQADFVLDNEGHRIGEIYDTHFVERDGKRYISQVSRRRVVKASQIPRMLFNAFISVEDKRFREHKGFDFQAVRRLFYGGAEGAKQGGSTITMQLVKNAFFDKDVEHERATGLRTLRRKIKELLMLPKIEGHYSKDQILTYYLNLINLTPRAQGVEMAAQDLFGIKDLHQLSAGEMAMLAAMPKGANEFNPRRHPKAAKARRDIVLNLMAQQGYLTPAQAKLYSREEIHLAPPPEERRARILSRYYVGYLTDHFRALKKKHLSDPRWSLGGLDIRTPLNLQLQRVIVHSLQDGLLNFEKTTGRYHYKPWTDSAGHVINIRERVKSGASVKQALEAIRPADPYPDTDWLLAAKVPSTRGRWILENGQTTPVDGGDGYIYRRLREYDVVLLAPPQGEGGHYRLASGTKVQGAAVMIDIRTGEVLGLSGGFTSGPYGRFAQNNRATGSFRQIGSAIKPFLYLYALNHGVQPDSDVANIPVVFPKIPKCPYLWHPGNYSGEREGARYLPMETALAHSVNRAALGLFLKVAEIPFRKYGTDFRNASPALVTRFRDTLYDVYSFAAEFGAYPTLKKLWASGYKGPCLPFLLGAQETSPLRLAQAYASLANGGLKRRAIFMRQVMKDGEPLIVDKTAELRDQAKQYAYALKAGLDVAPQAFGAIDGVSPLAVANIRMLMQAVLREGTGHRLKDWADIMAGKTGTTNNSKDAWFIGYNSRVALAVWVGYDDTREYQGLGHATGATAALPIFQSIMTAYYQMHPDELNLRFPKPSAIFVDDSNSF